MNLHRTTRPQRLQAQIDELSRKITRYEAAVENGFWPHLSDIEQYNQMIDLINHLEAELAKFPTKE